MGEDQPEKKIIVDEDWKTQVQRERENLTENSSASPTTQDEATVTTGSAPQTNDDPSPQPAEPTMPPASFDQLISMLATSAMVHLGQIPDPVDQKVIVNLPVARYYIDLLDVLGEKTKGNLTEQEAGVLQSASYQLRMAFVSKSNSAQ